LVFLTREFLRSGEQKYLFLIGIALGFGLVSKYTVLAILPAIFLEFLLNPERRKTLLKPGLYLALVIALVIFGPVIYWNFSQGWPSFKFQFANRMSHTGSLQFKYIFQLIVSQLFVLTPFVLFLLFATVKNLLFDRHKFPRARFLLLTGAFIIGGFILYSFTSLVKMNWLLPGYVGLIISAGLIYNKETLLRSRWARAGLASSVVLIILSHLILLIPNIPLGEGNTWSGWKDAAKKISALQTAYGNKEACFIFTNSYKAASLLKFYLPVEQEVYAQNIYDEPALQFDIWGVPDSLRGKNALYVFSDRREYKANLSELENYFDNVRLVGEFEYTFMGNVHVRTIYCYLAENYVGKSRF
jgi:hypothetical protein